MKIEQIDNLFELGEITLSQKLSMISNTKIPKSLELIDTTVLGYITYAIVSYGNNLMDRQKAIRVITDNTDYNEGSAQIGLTMWGNFTNQEKTHKRTFKVSEIPYYKEYARQLGVEEDLRQGLLRYVEYATANHKMSATKREEFLKEIS